MSISMIAIFPMSRETTNNPIKTAKFVIASWGFPSDEYGQGIDKVGVFENSTGSWLPLETIDYDESSECEIYTNTSIKLEVWTWQNSTLTGATDWTEGKKYQRHSVNVNIGNGTLVFSQQNFTYEYCFPAIDPPLWYYGYSVVLNFLPDYGQIYTATITYEIYW